MTSRHAKPKRRVGHLKPEPQEALSAAPSFGWTRESAVALAKTLLALRKKKMFHFNVLVRESGLAQSDLDIEAVQQRFSRWINNADKGERWKSLRESEYHAILAYLRKRNLLVSGVEETILHDVFPDAMFHGMAQWLGMSGMAVDELRESFAGIYTVYRHSLLKPGHVNVGRLAITYDEQSKAVKTHETYIVEGSESTSATHFEMRGYLFRRNGCYRILSKHVGLDELQIIYLNSTIPRGGVQRSRDIIRMSGVVTDVQGRDYYSTRICCTRHEREEDINVRTITPEDAKALRITEILEPPKLPDTSGRFIAIF